MSTFLLYPPGITAKITGMGCSSHGRSYYALHHCGSLLTVDVVFHFRTQQIIVDGKERSVNMAYHVSDGIDS